MPDGTILSRTSAFDYLDDVNYEIPMQTETVLGGGPAWLSGGGRLAVPSAYFGEHVEFFMSCDGLNLNTSDNAYIGVIGTNDAGTATWYGIKEDLQLMSRGFRSGPVLITEASEMYLRLQTFGSVHSSIQTRGTTLGCLVGIEDPIAQAAAFDANGVVLGDNTTTVLSPTEEYDPDGIYDAATGIFTAPSGATCYVMNVSGYSSPFQFTEFYYTLQKNGVTVVQYMHYDSGHSAGPGCLGLHPCVAGDEIRAHIFADGTGGTMTQERVEVEFY